MNGEPVTVLCSDTDNQNNANTLSSATVSPFLSLSVLLTTGNRRCRSAREPTCVIKSNATSQKLCQTAGSVGYSNRLLSERFGFVRNRQPAAIPGEGLKECPRGVLSLPSAGCGYCRALRLICTYLTLRRLRPEVLVPHVQLINIRQKRLREQPLRFAAAGMRRTAKMRYRTLFAFLRRLLPRCRWDNKSLSLFVSGIPRLGFICSLLSLPSGRG